MHCQPCPCPASQVCLGEGHRRYCDRLDEPAVIRHLLAGGLAQVVTREESTATMTWASADRSGLAGFVVSGRGEDGSELTMRLAMDAELCPSGSGSCGCGSSPPRICGHPDHPLEVRAADCLRCVGLAHFARV
jgi:hypothetical protein